MSPRDILNASGAGQGSLYHHFAGKKAIALEALSEVSAEMQAELERVFDQGVAPLDRLRRYLSTDRQGLRGCRLGRLANESALADASLRGPLDRYFRLALHFVEQALRDSVAEGTLRKSVDTGRVAAAIVASVQGGFVLSRALGDSTVANDATAGALALLDSLSIAR